MSFLWPFKSRAHWTPMHWQVCSITSPDIWIYWIFFLHSFWFTIHNLDYIASSALLGSVCNLDQGNICRAFNSLDIWMSEMDSFPRALMPTLRSREGWGLGIQEGVKHWAGRGYYWYIHKGNKKSRTSHHLIHITFLMPHTFLSGLCHMIQGNKSNFILHCMST